MFNHKKSALISVIAYKTRSKINRICKRIPVQNQKILYGNYIGL